MHSSAGIGPKHHFGLAISIEILASLLFVEHHAVPVRSKHHSPRAVVDRRGTFLLDRFRIPRRPERDFIAVPKFLLVRGIVFAVSITRNFVLRTLRSKHRRKAN